MENSAKALYMAGSLLIALLVVSLLVYAFNNLGGVQNEKDKIEIEEDISKFNREYEAYNKKLMYGVDVISCINKAISNNEKYFKEGRWAQGGASGKEALVDVVITGMNEPLEEKLSVYYMDSNGKERELYSYTEDDPVSKVVLKDVFEKMPGYTAWDKDDTVFQTQSKPLKEITSFKLIERDVAKSAWVTGEKSLYELVRNGNSADMELISKRNTGNLRDWSYIKWTTCLYNFKKMKFSCSNINYSEATGRIDSITFEKK